jgi:hypothetical protein
VVAKALTEGDNAEPIKDDPLMSFNVSLRLGSSAC